MKNNTVLTARYRISSMALKWLNLSFSAAFAAAIFVAIRNDASLPMLIMLSTGVVSMTLLIQFLISAQRKKNDDAQAAFKECRRLSSIIEGAHIGTWEWRIPTGELRFNERWAEILGYKIEELLPVSMDSWTSFCHPDDFLRSKKLLSDHLSGKTDRYECRIRMRSKNGKWIWVLNHGRLVTRLPDGSPEWINGTHQDITNMVCAQEAAEESSRRSQQALIRLKAIYDILPVGLTITDRKGKIIDCNPASERILGIAREAQVNRYWSDRNWTVLREDDSIMPTDEFPSIRALHSQKPVNDHLMKFIHGDKHTWISVSAMPVSHDEMGVVSAYVDVTEQRNQSDALLEAKKIAEQANQSKSQFLANMSHEIRTPMNAILGMLSLLRRTELTPRQAEYAGKTQGAAKSLLVLLDDILDFSKVEAGKMTLDPQSFEVDGMLQNLSVILSTNAAGKRLEVLYELDPALPKFLIGDSTRLQQILINLGGNAVKFTSQGEVVVSIKCKKISKEEVTVEFAVRDTGIGIAQESQKKIFEGFTQAEASTTRRFGGTGLGVVICQRLVQLMGGELKLSSELGKGSRFFFEITMPVADVAEVLMSEVDLMVESDDDFNKPVRVLIVDDSPTARRSIEISTKSLGWLPVLVDSGEKAVDLVVAQPNTFDLILVDWTMPGMNGWQTCKVLKEEGSGLGHARLFMVTAQGHEMLATRTQEEQSLISGFVVKPVTSKMLKEAWKNTIAEGLAKSAGMPMPKINRNEELGPRRLEGIHILVAEDNPNNQQVVRELLEDEGASLEMVGNGLEAVVALGNSLKPYDVVLMDLQMPIMDGLTASRKIRNDLGKKHLPIVAMTANAMTQDREACLQAGMNEHIGKPFSLDHLVATILNVTGRKSTDTVVIYPCTIDLSEEVIRKARQCGIDLSKSLQRLGGNVGTYRRLLKNFIEGINEDVLSMKRSLAHGEHASLSRQAHTLKGLCATLGMADMSLMAAQVEKLFDKGIVEDIDGRFEAMLSNLIGEEVGLMELSDLLRDHNETEQRAASDGKISDPGELMDYIKKLKTLLIDVDMEAVNVIEKMRMLNLGVYAKTLQEIDDNVVELRFDEAIQKCEAFISENSLCQQ